jgi:tRNA 2-selenouridine synthase
MRSAAMAWLLNLYGFSVKILIGGYKAYRAWCLQQLEITYPFAIIGGYTGSGKSYVLPHLIQAQNNIIDLENLAHHKGSAFGAIGMPKQPSQEMFENKLALALCEVNTNAVKNIFVEDESQRIGNVQIPQNIWLQMRAAKVYFLEIEFEKRLQHILTKYGHLPQQELIDAVTRITRNLGGLEAKNVVAFLQENNTQAAFEILLKYYDKYYKKGLLKRDNLEAQLVTIRCNNVDAKKNARLVLGK